jgi:hypothetical protein
MAVEYPFNCSVVCPLLDVLGSPKEGSPVEAWVEMYLPYRPVGDRSQSL